MQIDSAIAKETLRNQRITSFWVNNLRMAVGCFNKLKGDIKLLYEIMDKGVYQIKERSETGKNEKAKQVS